MVNDNIILKEPERWSKPHVIAKEKLEAAAKAACDKLKKRTLANGPLFPGTCSKDHKYVLGENNNWECGMFTGCFWLAYELTGDEFFKNVAEEHLLSYKRRIDERIGMDDHDVGFVFTPSCIAAHKLTGDENAKKWALEAAKYEYDYNYSKEGKFIIRVHGSWYPGFRTMMDSLMNAPLFFWAAEQTGDKDYYNAGLDHNLTTAKYLVRDDGSTFHHFQFDPETAGPVGGLTFQGHKDDSCWSRGHAWGVYGFPIAYSYTKNEVIKETHRGVTYFMLNHLPKDNIPYWDYDFVEGEEPRDASAGAISACGLHEMAGLLPDTDPDKAIFESAAAQLLEAVIDVCTGEIGKEYDGLINHVTHAKPQGQGIDECAVYGDYFYLEALCRYPKPDFKKYW